MKQTLGEYKNGTLHSGSKTGPVVTNRKQAIAIALNEKAKPAVRPLAKPSRPVGAMRTPSIKHPGEGYDLSKMHTSKHR